MVLMDCGCSLDGYNTDMTRVGVAGEPTNDQKNVHSIVLRANESAIEKLKPGLQCGAADGIARRIIEEAGYGDEFTHRLGHGIGLEVHEHPYITRGNAQLLEPGMTHSVEPGIYMEGKFGVRVEDLVAITESGAEVLTFSPKELFVIAV
jgi:Xaa-Pro dipeptidase